MPTYVVLVKWTEQGIRTVKDTLTRNQQVNAAVEQAGGRVIGVWWTQGAYDQVGVAELPDDETATALALGAAMRGSVRTETMRAYTAEEMHRILQKLPQLSAAARWPSPGPAGRPRRRRRSRAPRHGRPAARSRGCPDASDQHTDADGHREHKPDGYEAADLPLAVLARATAATDRAQGVLPRDRVRRV
jgi:uncharacterized protein with GYD domain